MGIREKESGSTAEGEGHLEKNGSVNIEVKCLYLTFAYLLFI